MRAAWSGGACCPSSSYDDGRHEQVTWDCGYDEGQVKGTHIVRMSKFKDSVHGRSDRQVACSLAPLGCLVKIGTLMRMFRKDLAGGLSLPTPKPFPRTCLDVQQTKSLPLPTWYPGYLQYSKLPMLCSLPY